MLHCLCYGWDEQNKEKLYLKISISLWGDWAEDQIHTSQKDNLWEGVERLRWCIHGVDKGKPPAEVNKGSYGRGHDSIKLLHFIEFQSQEHATHTPNCVSSDFFEYMVLIERVDSQNRYHLK